MTDTLQERIAGELRAELSRQDHTGRWLADQTGLSVTSTARWLKGTRAPGLLELDAMCAALNLTIADLMTRVDAVGGYRRTVIPLPRGGVAVTDAQNTATSDQKVRGSNPFGCTEAEIVRLPVRGRRRRDSVTPHHVVAVADAA